MYVTMPCAECRQRPVCKMNNRIQVALKQNEKLTGHIDIVCSKFILDNSTSTYTDSNSTYPCSENYVYFPLNKEEKCDAVCRFVDCCVMEEDVDLLLELCEQLTDDNIIANVTCRFCQPVED